MDDVQAMRRTIAIARESHQRGDLPFASIVMRDDEVIAEGWNEVLSSKDVSAHAEIVALRNATRRLGHVDLSDCVLYASSEPCVMCSAAIRATGIKRVVFSVPNAQFGGYSSRYPVLTDTTITRFGAAPEVTPAFLREEGQENLDTVGWISPE